MGSKEITRPKTLDSQTRLHTDYTAWSVKTVQSVMKSSPRLAQKWHYEFGLMLKAIEQVWIATGDDRYFNYIKENMDEFIAPEGNILTYRLEEYNLDQINTGKVLFALYRKTGKEKYEKAVHLLWKQLRTHPRTGEGSFWHKKIYPHQVWLDGIYMAGPFYAEYARVYNKPQAFTDITGQIIRAAYHMRDAKTGLFYHGWDESKRQKWADPATGCSPHFWGRAMGWYAMALVDVLDYLPEDQERRQKIIDIFQKLVSSLVLVQDNRSGLWYQVLDRGDEKGNYPEASCSCMFVYAVAKGIKKGYIPPKYLGTAVKGFKGIINNLVEVEPGGGVNLKQVCKVAGLGRAGPDHPYRDGSFAYYVSEPVEKNDYKGLAPFIMAGLEMGKVTGQKEVAGE